MKVLLTGATGFIGAHCLQKLIEQGNTVVIAVRDKTKGEEALRPYADEVASGIASFVVVEDITVDGAFDDAVRSNPPFDTVLHAASPFHFRSKNYETEMIVPAVRGTLGILKSIHAYAPMVKRVVVTSSMAAVLNYKSPPPTYEEQSWNPITKDEACSDPVSAYLASKTFAERSAWDFIAAKKPNFTMATINPPAVFGPPIHGLKSLNAINTSNEKFADIICGKWKDGLPPSRNGQWVHVGDVADAHVRALEIEEAANRRFLLVAGDASNAEIVAVVGKEFPTLREQLPDSTQDENAQRSPSVDTTPAESILGIHFVDLEKSIKQTISALLLVHTRGGIPAARCH